MKIIIIAAASQNNVIGNSGIIPWNSSEEMMYFKETTMGFPVIMGKKTWETFKQPLIGRINIVLSHQIDYQVQEGVHLFHSLSDSLAFCKKQLVENCFIIGGAEVYQEAIQVADEIMLSRMNLEIDGDTYFPDINPNTWKEKATVEYKDFCLHVYIRKDNNSRELIGR